jgi:hypothetical protein
MYVDSQLHTFSEMKFIVIFAFYFCQNSRGTIKILPCSKALNAEHRPKFAALSPVMVTAAR